MRITGFDVGSVLFVLAAVVLPAAADDGTTVFTECNQLRVSLEGADHYNWITPEQGRVVLVRQCVPAEADCDHDVVTVWDEQGRRIFEAAPFLDIPEMSGGSVIDAALRTPDRLVVSAIVGTTDFKSVLAEYDVGTGDLLHLVPTGPIQCRDLHGDDEGVTWCLGVDIARRRDDEDHALVYRFDESGQLQGSTLPRSAYPPSPDPLTSTGRAGTGGGFLTGDGETRLWLPAVGELVSFDEEGHVIDRLVLPMIENQQRSRIVSAPDSAVYAMLIVGENEEPGEWNQALYRLADDGSEWLPVQSTPVKIPRRIALVGADDSGLILLDRKTLMLCHLPLATGANAGN
jgi:hypothetical protein